MQLGKRIRRLCRKAAASDMYKKIGAFVLAIAVLLPSLSGFVDAAEGGLVYNGGFEEADGLGYAVGWSRQVDGAVGAADRVEKGGDRGAFVRLTPDGGTAAIETAPDRLIAVREGMAYRLDFSAYAADELTVTVRQYDENGAELTDCRLPIGTATVRAAETWQRTSAEFRVSENVAKIALCFYANGGEAGVDRVQLSETRASDKTAYVATAQPITYAVPAEGTIEYVKNGGFEEDFSGNWYVSATVKPQVSNEIYHSGAASLMLDRSGSQATQFVSQTVTGLVPGQSYTLTYWQKIVGGAQIYAKIYQFDAAGGIVFNQNFNVTANTGDADWQQKTATFTVADTAASVRVDFNHNFYSGQGYFDDVSLTESAPVPEEDRTFKNGDFESGLDHWTTSGGTPSVSRDEKHGGSAALHLERKTASDATQAVYQADIAAEAGENYQLDYYQKIVGSAQIYVQIYQFDAAGSILSNKNYNITRSTVDVDWKKQVVRFLTEEKTASLRIELYNNDLIGSGYFDDMTLKKVAPLTDDGLLKNGDFAYRDFATWKAVNNGNRAGDFDFFEDEEGYGGTKGFARLKNSDPSERDSGSRDYFGMNSANSVLPEQNGSYHLSFYVRANAAAHGRFRVMVTRRDAGGQNLAVGAMSYTDIALSDTDGWQKINYWFDANGAASAAVTILLFDGAGEAVCDIDCATLQLVKAEPIGANLDFTAGEIGSVPANWSVGGNAAGTVESVVSPNGTLGCKITFPEKEDQPVNYVFAQSQAISVTAGKSYEITYYGKVIGDAKASGWVQINQWKNTGRTQIVRGAEKAVSPFGHYRFYGEQGDSAQFVQMRHSFVASTEAACIDLQFMATGGASFIIDDVVVRELSSAETAPNLDFENDTNGDGIPDNYYLSTARDPHPSLTIDTGFYHDGRQSMHVHREGKTQTGTIDSAARFRVTPGAVYEFSFFMASANADPRATVRMDLVFWNADGTKLFKPGTQTQQSIIGRTAVLNGNSTRDNWSQVYTRTMIPDGAVYASVQFNFTQSKSDVWLDDIFIGVVMDDTQDIVLHNDFHAMDQDGNIAGWTLENVSGSAALTVRNAAEDSNRPNDNIAVFTDANGVQTEEDHADYGRLTATGGENYMKLTTSIIATEYQYVATGRYRADAAATVEVRFYDYRGSSIAGKTKSVALPATNGAWSEFSVSFIAPSCTYAAVAVGLNGAGTVDADDIFILQTGRPITQGAWSGQWVWYPEDYKASVQQYRYFRYEFDLADEATFAPLQVTADDNFAFYVNGREVYNNLIGSTDTWADVQVLYLTGTDESGEPFSYLHKGKNVFAFKVFNNVSECGLLFDGKWKLADGAELSVISEPLSVISYKPSDGVSEPPAKNGKVWYETAYETDRAWYTCKSFGMPPCTPWGNIFYNSSIYSQNSITVTDIKNDGATVKNGTFTFEMTMTLEKALTSTVPLKAAIWVRNSVDQASAASLVPVTETDMTQWPVGREFTVQFRMTVPSYLASGRYTLQWDDTYISIANEDITDGKFISFRLVNEVENEETVAEIVTENGAPTLKVNGEPVSFFAYSRPDYNQFNWDHEAAMSKAGMEVYTVRQGGLGKNSLDFCWPADGVVDFDAFDKPIYETLSNNPDAFLNVQVGMYAPSWWFETHPEDRVLVSHADGSFTNFAESQTFASETFMKEAGEVLRQLMEHMKSQSYYSRVIDIQVTSGTSFENMYWGGGSTTYTPDFSEPYIKKFQSWLEKKYGTVEALQAAWKDPSITTFYDYTDYDWSATDGLSESARWKQVLPTWWDHIKNVRVRPRTFAEQAAYEGVNKTYLNNNNGFEQQVIDQNLFLMDIQNDNMLYWGRIVDDVHEGKKLTSCFNGYLFAGTGAHDISRQHAAFVKMLRDDTYDFFVSPAVYSERELGGSDSYMGAQDTVQAYGKLVVIEEDHRTPLIRNFGGVSWDAADDFSVGATRTMEEFLLQVKKNTTNALVSGNGMWMFDMQGGWFDDDQFYQLTQEIKAEWDISQYLKKDLTGEVAYYIPDEAAPYLSLNYQSYSAQILNFGGQRIQRRELQRIGNTFDVYQISSLVDGKVPDHKINLIFSPYQLTDEEKAAIDRELKRDGKIIVWIYACGVSDGKTVDIDHATALTGIPLVMEERLGAVNVKVTDDTSPVTTGMKGAIYGVENGVDPIRQSPVIYGDRSRLDGSFEVLGTLMDNGAPALIKKDMGDWTSIYSSAVAIPVAMLRNLMQMTDVHTYTDDLSANVFANGAYVGIHSASDGTKTVRLPETRAVYDVYERRFVSMSADSFTYENEKNGTHLFRLTTPNTYTVVARVRGGHGTLSANGLTEVPVGKGYTLQITPDKGYEIASVTVNGKAVDVTEKLDWAQLTENKSILVRFSKIGTSDEQPTPDPTPTPAPEPTPTEPDPTPAPTPTPISPEPDDEPTPIEPEPTPTDNPVIRTFTRVIRRLNMTAVMGIVGGTLTAATGGTLLILWLVRRKKKHALEELEKEGETS